MLINQLQELSSEIKTLKWPPLVLAALTFCILLYKLGQQIEPLLTTQHTLKEIYVHGGSYVSYHVTHFKPQPIPTVIMLGGSAIRESTVLNQEFEKLFTSKYRKKINFLNLASSSQNIFESIAIANTLDLPDNSIIFMQASYKKFIYSEDDLSETYFNPKMVGLDDSPLETMMGHTDQIIRAAIPKLIFYRYPISYFIKKKCSWLEVFDNQSSCYRLKNVHRHQYIKKDGMTTTGKNKYTDKLRRNVYPKFQKNYKFTMEAYSLLANVATSKNSKIIFLDLPTDPQEKSLYEEVQKHPAYPETIKHLNNLGVFLDWKEDPSYSPKDFHDTQHMKKNGKKIFSKKLAAFIYNYYFEEKESG